ncbi:uncharacterized protein F4822DRAFT_435477 [Hypoxylon trugodes]|uniref:uncharacterized protein n=1 Tax=Hypoxylon trugodes TaxID=326681 RepID=UPI0021A21288|nr:uncharacterized protein F4822DRAFT_435477 [Hypoxylon trugodes]KAI1382537.1 hypothetical protein F4822DRAFT_435477 [Hypoxylon trugodes]
MDTSYTALQLPSWDPPIYDLKDYTLPIPDAVDPDEIRGSLILDTSLQSPSFTFVTSSLESQTPTFPPLLSPNEPDNFWGIVPDEQPFLGLPFDPEDRMPPTPVVDDFDKTWRSFETSSPLTHATPVISPGTAPLIDLTGESDDEKTSPMVSQRDQKTANRGLPDGCCTPVPSKRSRDDNIGTQPSSKRRKKHSTVNIRATRVWLESEEIPDGPEYTWDRRNGGSWKRKSESCHGCEHVEGEFLLCYAYDWLYIEVRANADWFPLTLRWSKKHKMFQGEGRIAGIRLQVQDMVMMDLICGSKGKHVAMVERGSK